MSTTPIPTYTADAVGNAKQELIRARDRILKDLAVTPDDKINWSPSATARTPVQLVAHAAMSAAGIQDWMSGTPFKWASPAEADAEWRQAEKQFTTRDQVVGLMEKNCNAYLAWMDALTEEQLNSTFTMPFGSFPMAVAITFLADHIRCHAAQLEYLQTIYGDIDWHMGP